MPDRRRDGHTQHLSWDGQADRQTERNVTLKIVCTDVISTAAKNTGIGILSSPLSWD